MTPALSLNTYSQSGYFLLTATLALDPMAPNVFSSNLKIVTTALLMFFVKSQPGK